MTRVSVLDQGYVEVIEHWGSDENVIASARMSTSGAFRGWGPTCAECGWSKGDDHEAGCSEPDRWKAGDEKLLRYLWENAHHTPFEMAGMTIEVQAPIFVFREWHRHRSQSFNELSARYTPVPDVNYVPSLERCMIGSDGRNKQAGTIKGAALLTEDSAREWLEQIEAFYTQAETLYQYGLASGLPKELARIVVPVGRYSRMRASANLRNWLAFLKLRTSWDAQWEIREYARVVGDAIAQRFPRTWELFSE